MTDLCSIVSKIPLIADFFDMRAQPSEGAPTWIDTLRVAAPAGLLAATNTADQLAKALAGFPALATVGDVSPPLLITGYAVAVIVSRNSQQSAIEITGASVVRYNYRYSNLLRIAAKLFLIPLVVLSIVALYANLPNIMTGALSVSGVICDTKAAPIENGEISALDRLGRNVSLGGSRLDSLGAFNLKMRPWALRPETLKVQLADCDAEVPLVESLPSGEAGCPQNPYGGILSNNFRERWSVDCHAKPKT